MTARHRQQDPRGRWPRPAEPAWLRAASGHGWPRLLFTALAAGALTSAVALGWDTLTRAVAGLAGLNAGWFALAACCEAASLTAFGLSRRLLLRAGGHRAGLGSVMAITYAGNALSMAVPFAGTELALVYSYREFRRRGLDPPLTGWALTVSGIASSSALAVVLVAGALVGGRPLTSALGFLAAAMFALPGLTVLLAVRCPRSRVAVTRALTWLVRQARHVTGRPGIAPATLETFLARLASIRLEGRGYAAVFGLAMLNWLADCACFACAILAASGTLPGHALLLAYGAGAAAGSTGVTPGGFGLVELTLTAALSATGLAATTALTAVLAYRLLNFWLILLCGGITMMVLARTASRDVRAYPPSLPQ